ncbi:hypothetical protein JDV02_005777 [Purpureocillium takamizusanense]|uniref:Uncharacterized protein n=1 Tax=Purpureocillium takamizusanense TaxID=2060973 RepID=A0A9Q8QJ83_9HYPO|nr:uncharacterized protein JDV02_005777 [Purpureocillium takamizusanense]UNI19597.1 hypothetical protein JDV02_005777 [Purpureocillium takamizusanense]
MQTDAQLPKNTAPAGFAQLTGPACRRHCPDKGTTPRLKNSQPATPPSTDHLRRTDVPGLEGPGDLHRRRKRGSGRGTDCGCEDSMRAGHTDENGAAASLSLQNITLAQWGAKHAA